MEVEQFSTKIALLIGRSQGFEGLENLPKVDQELNTVRQGLETVGFQQSEIFEIKNKDNAELGDDLGADQIDQMRQISNTG